MPMVPRDELVLSTKSGIKMSDKPNDAGVGRKHLMSAIDAQLKRLKTDYIDVYHIHRLDPHTPLEEGDVLARWARALGQGALHRGLDDVGL